MLDKLSPTVNLALDIIDNNNRTQDSLKEHLKSQTESIEEAGHIYDEAMIRREKER